MTRVESEPEVDGLDLGRPPRAPMTSRRKRQLGALLLVAALAAAVAVVVFRPGDERPAPAAARTPTVESSAGFAAGPVLVTVNGRDALQAPGLPGLGASVTPVVLEPAPEIVALVTAALPGFRDVRGGRIPNGDGVYLAGTYDGTGGAPVDMTLYTVRAPGTTYGTDEFVSRTRFDREYTVRTDVAVFTGSDWWVHVVTLGPDDPDTVRTGEVARVLPLARNPKLVATT